MKILHLSKMDAGGGAADGFVRIHLALLQQGQESLAYVIKHRRHDVPCLVDARTLLGPWRRLRWAMARGWAKLRRLHLRPVGVYDFDAEANYPAEAIIRHAKARSERWDMVVVHWSGGFVRAETVHAIANALGAMVALWQVDMAHSTGGCHSNLGCDKYRSGCGACPLIGSQDPEDVSAAQATRRARTWRQLGAVVLAPSGWSARQAAESLPLRGLAIRTFPIPLDLEVLRPSEDPVAARRALGLPEKGRILLARALDPALTYKGFGLLLAALRRLDDDAVAVHVALLGERGHVPSGFRHVRFTELGMRHGDAAMALAYQASDVFVSPSTNETGPMMAGEAMACGCPVVAYPIGIAPDLITPGCNGAMVEPVGDVDAMAAAIRSYVEMPAAELAAQRRGAVETAARTFSTAAFAARMLSVVRP
jgi:glycosyltransferase involved in cell wall biosynthesis